MNRFDRKKRKHPHLRQVLSGVVLFLCASYLFLHGIAAVRESSAESQAESLCLAIRRSAVHCYAMEGSYPESLDVIRERYGIDWDPERYLVDYEIIGSNLMPAVTVIIRS